MRLLKIALILVAILACLYVGFFWLLPRMLFHEYFKKAGQLTSAVIYTQAGNDLARLCQTCIEHPDWFADEPAFAPAWTPQSVLQFHPTWVAISPENARVEYGGGFHHYGYDLQLESPPTGPDQTATWSLFFYSEDSMSRQLGTFSLTRADILSEAEFVDRAMTEFDRRIVDEDCYPSVSVERCEFAIKHDHVARVRRAIRETAQQYPDAWLDVLLAYVLDYPLDSEAAAVRLRKWAESKGDFSAWLMAAYALEKVGEHDAAEEAARQAIKYSANDPRWVQTHARARGFTMCYQLYLSGRYETCQALCDNLLAYQNGGDDMTSSIDAIRAACRIAQEGETPPELSMDHAVEEYHFDPFAGLDIDVLRTVSNP